MSGQLATQIDKPYNHRRCPVIDLTDEIQRAYAEAWYRTIGMGEDDVQEVVAAELRDPMPWRLAALQAVLALVERDYDVRERIQTRCGAAGPDRLACQRSPEHGSNHAASNGDELVQW